MKKAEECGNKSEIREEIDAIDKKIIELFGKRYEYVKAIVKYKEKTPDSIVAAKRRDLVLEKRGEWAAEHGLNSDVFKEIYRILIDYFISEEMKILKIEPNK